MRFAAVAILLAAAAVLASGWSEGEPAVVEVTVTSIQDGVFRALETAAPNGREAPLASVAQLVPETLPAPIANQGSCVRGTIVEIRLADGTVASYGRCRLPDAIRWLGYAVRGEAGEWSGSATVRTRIVGATAPERRAMARIIDSMKPTRIQAVRIAPLSSLPGWRAYKRPADDRAFVVTAGDSLRAEWEAQLLAAHYAAIAGHGQVRPIAVFRLPRREYPVSSSGSLATSSASLALVRERAVTAGVEIVELRRVASGVALTVMTPDPAAFLKHDAARVLAALSGENRSTYFGVEDGSGAVVYAGGWTPSSGMLAGRPDLKDCGPVRSFGGPALGPATQLAPACPA